MFLKEEKEKLERMLEKNKKLKLKPSNYTELAETVGVSRNTIWLAIHTDKVKNAECKIKMMMEQIEEQKKKVVKVREEKVEELEKYGFEKQEDGTFATKLIGIGSSQKSNIKTCYIVDENLEIRLYITNAYSLNKIVERTIEDITLLYELIRDGVAYLEEKTYLM